jgi:hypothetical protein
VTTKALSILDIDVECLPGHWIGGDYVSKLITAVAWKWIAPAKQPEVYTHYEFESEDLADILRGEMSAADIVTGHYIRGFDLPLVNGNLQRGARPPIESVFAQDTKLDLYKSHGRSLSQKNLAAQLGVPKPKVDVTLFEWECFNTRRPGYEQVGKDRCRGDVLQHVELRQVLLSIGWLGTPAMWYAESKGGSGGYRP